MVGLGERVEFVAAELAVARAENNGDVLGGRARLDLRRGRII